MTSDWDRHDAEWRDPAAVASQWRDAANVDPELFRARARGDWWDLLQELELTLFVTREYEHLVMALSAADGKAEVSYFPLPHPSGLVVDRRRGLVHIASTRNPNQVFEFRPTAGIMDVFGADARAGGGSPLIPVASTYLPGATYLHDLALVGGVLHGNAVGHNAVVSLADRTGATRVWWPRCVEIDGRPQLDRNYLQLNSIAAGSRVRDSYFSASCDSISARRPGHLNFPVDGRGVVFSGATREPVLRGLTRPHSARLHRRRLWVDNSGYGEVGFAQPGGQFEVVARLPGWTRGLCLVGDVAFVGTSRVIPRFRHYAPGLDVRQSVCAIHALDSRSGKTLGVLTWPAGDQIFAIDWAKTSMTYGFPFSVRRRAAGRERELFYAFLTK